MNENLKMLIVCCVFLVLLGVSQQFVIGLIGVAVVFGIIYYSVKFINEQNASKVGKTNAN